MVHLFLAVIYLSFISLGLPDALLGSAWPSMYGEFDVPVAYAGGISMIISFGTIVSSLQSDRLTRKFGTGMVTAFSVFLTAAALFGFSVSRSYWALCFWAVPYGLGAGSVDASLNNYVALHYESRHMSWLHCMWGIGASCGPYIMGAALSGGYGWNMGYRAVSVIQMILTAVLFISLPLWKDRGHSDGGNRKKMLGAASPDTRRQGEETGNASDTSLPLGQIVRIPGAKEVMVTFLCYCALESTMGLWASSYLVIRTGLSAEVAAGLASLFYIGITAGRIISGFLTFRMTDEQMIRLGQMIIGGGILIMILPGALTAQTALLLVGLGCAPIYPSVIHSTPSHFGADKSQAVIGVQMASAYVGSCLAPPFFGLIANHLSVSLLPVFLTVVLALMAAMHERLLRSCGVREL